MQECIVQRVTVGFQDILIVIYKAYTANVFVAILDDVLNLFLAVVCKFVL